jgi:hypothetical protein
MQVHATNRAESDFLKIGDGIAGYRRPVESLPGNDLPESPHDRLEI